MNILQKKQLELLKYFIEVCEKLELSYYLVCGSALGAIKYNGFIPWDDDVDVALPRDDYDIFCEKASELLPEWIFVQNYKTDPQFPKIFTKLRDVNTTYIEKEYSHLNICHGVFIDVFALDGYPSKKCEIKMFERKKRKYVRQISCSLNCVRTKKGKILCKINRILGYHKRTPSVLKKYEKLIKSYNQNDVWCNYGNYRGKMKILPKELYGHGKKAFFEDVVVSVPEQYDKYLEIFYGDWRGDLPKEEQVGHHYYEKLDLEVSYKQYV